MSLPKIDYPIYNLTIPSLKKKCKFRPFLVKEEKLLLMAKESKNPSDILMTVKQVVNNCILDKTVKIEKLPIFDLEYIFLKLRALSVDNIVKITYKDFEDNKDYNFEINLEEVEVQFPEKVDNKIKLSDRSGIVMNYPNADLYDDKDFLNKSEEHTSELQSH